MIAEWAALPPVATGVECEVVIAGSDLPPPAITYLVRQRLWQLERDYLYVDDGWHIHVRKGFRFDLASIPRPAWRLCAPFELSITAPLIHDALYRYAGRCWGWAEVHPDRDFTRAEADQLFLAMMKAEGVPLWRRRPAYAAVRLWGGGSWRETI